MTAFNHTHPSATPDHGVRPMVSIIIPCRNEADFIGGCLDSIAGCDYPRGLIEVLVVDGMSDDETRQVVTDRMLKHEFVRLVLNPMRTTPFALNIGLREARGAVLMRMDAHATYCEQYVSLAVDALLHKGADNVGGVWRIEPRDAGPVARAVVGVLRHRFGVGNARYRISSGQELQWVDTVPCFCCRRELFDRVGHFNEKLARGQDMEFSRRLRRAGFRTLLMPQMVMRYFARTDLPSFVQHAWTDGVWVVLSFAYTDKMPVKWRHLVPLAFVVSLVVGGATAAVYQFARLPLMMVVAFYGCAACFASAQIATRERSALVGAIAPFMFAALHIAYGSGSCWGVAKLVPAMVRHSKPVMRADA